MLHEEDGGLLGIVPDFAIPHRTLLLATDAGNLLWESVSLAWLIAIGRTSNRSARAGSADPVAGNR